MGRSLDELTSSTSCRCCASSHPLEKQPAQDAKKFLAPPSSSFSRTRSNGTATTFAAVLATCRVWVNGEEVDPATVLSERDEVAVLPPVSGG